MRDLVMFATFVLLLLPAIKRPYIAVGLWLWTAMFFPGGWVYGFALSIRYNLIFSIISIFGVFIQKNKPPAENHLITILVGFFLIWATLSYWNGIGHPDAMYEQWIKLLKIIALYYFLCASVNTKHQIDYVIWCLVLSVGFFGSVEGLKVIASGGAHHVEGMYGHVLSDRNELAMALCMCIPLTIYIRNQNQIKIIKLGLLGVTILMVLCILGTYSRGGLLGLLVLGLAYFKEAKNKFASAMLIGVIFFIASHLMSDEWHKRMDSIGDAQQDQSFMGRVIAWKVSLLLALDHPFLGGGFNAIGYTPVWLSYALQLQDKLTFIETPPPNLDHGWAAHSLFFQVLGDQGFVGLFLFVSILLVAYRKSIVVVGRCDKTSPYYELSKMLKLSIVTYVVTGLALSKVYFDLSFAIFALIRIVDRQTYSIAMQKNKIARSLSW